ncbi:fungal-specific transcription factor domain-containing protein [Xylariales sp. PMI_506]|nr:fungal-specific transcription factor domain-containing protein [Xylariales sp. PMI_506]
MASDSPGPSGGAPAAPNSITNSARPYRSHKIPACDFCHRRKSRCVRLRTDEPCLLCRSNQMQCKTTSAARDGPRRSTGKRRRTSQHPRLESSPYPSVDTAPQSESREKGPPRDQRDRQAALGTDVNVSGGEGAFAPGPAASQQMPDASTLNEASHIVGPVHARDAQVLEKYISPTYSSLVSHARPNPYSVYSDNPRNPVVYMKVPRQRGIDPSGNGTFGFKQCETIQKILEPLASDLFSLYFEVIHPAFPILDRRTVMNAYHQDGLPYALVCEIYAVSLISWHMSAKIRTTRRPVPDVRYIWNIAVSAMREDFTSPSFSTVLASILDLLGRPITSITYNAVNVGSTVALAHSLGLNRDPSNWDLDARQKSLRVRAWWCLLIHDHWASLSHGTPNHIQNDQWDVTLPTLESVAVGSAGDEGFDSDSHRKGAQSFIALCQLTKILGDILPLVYSLKPQKVEGQWKILRRIETDIDAWEDQLPYFLNPGDDELQRNAPGALNLKLSFLAVKMLICRVAVQISDPSDLNDMQYYQSKYRKAAKAVIDFVLSLTPDELWAFWLPYTAYHLTSASTLMMRCAIEANDEQTARECVSSAKSLIDYLRHAKDTASWDLADICLGQCAAIVDQMSLSSFAELQARRHLPDRLHNLRDTAREEWISANRKMPSATDISAAATLSSGSQPAAPQVSNPTVVEQDSEGFNRARSDGSPADGDRSIMDNGALDYGSYVREYLLEDDFLSNLWQSTHM